MKAKPPTKAKQPLRHRKVAGRGVVVRQPDSGNTSLRFGMMLRSMGMRLRRSSLPSSKSTWMRLLFCVSQNLGGGMQGQPPSSSLRRERSSTATLQLLTTPTSTPTSCRRSWCIARYLRRRGAEGEDDRAHRRQAAGRDVGEREPAEPRVPAQPPRRGRGTPTQHKSPNGPPAGTGRRCWRRGGTRSIKTRSSRPSSGATLLGSILTLAKPGHAARFAPPPPASLRHIAQQRVAAQTRPALPRNAREFNTRKKQP